MDTKRNKLRSLFKHVQTSTEEILSRKTSIISPTHASINSISSPFPSASSSSNTQLDLPSAIEYNHYLINSYLEERNSRQLPVYQQIIAESSGNDRTITECEQTIIDEIRDEFFLNRNCSDVEDDKTDDESYTSNLSTQNDDQLQSIGHDVEKHSDDQIDNNNASINKEIIIEENSQDIIQIRDEFSVAVLSDSKILELCVLERLPDISTFVDSFEPSNYHCDAFLTYIDNERKKLEKQLTIVSKRLSDIILENEKQFGSEMKRINEIDTSLQSAIKICGNGRKHLFLSRRDFTSTSLSIVDNYTCREAIVVMIKSLQQVKTIRSTIDHIKSYLEFEKNFPGAIRLYHETSETLERLASNYICVKEMKAKLVEMLLLAEEQMDQALSKMPTSFCPQTYQQLTNAYKQIGKSENSMNQLLMHFTNTIHDKAFSIVLGYVELFAEVGNARTSTPIKSRSGQLVSSNSFDLKRKPYTELCQYLKTESFLSCLTDLCKSMWDVMQNYFSIICFYRSNEQQRSCGLASEDIEFAKEKLQNGILRIWSDIQHKIRTLVSSVKFVELNSNSQSSSTDEHKPHIDQDTCQDQLLFTFEEFIKILTVCEKIIEIGLEFCALNPSNDKDFPDSVTMDFQNTLYEQTRAYFQSYHQVSMAELRIFLENETWTRCPVETSDELVLMAGLQEFYFIKNRLMNLRHSVERTDGTPKSKKSSISAYSSFLLSPLSKSKGFRSKYFQFEIETDDISEQMDSSKDNSISPFDDMISLVINSKVYDDPDEQEMPTKVNYSEMNNSEIATTNTALNVVRLTGRYLHIMYLLRPISHDIIKALMELYDYYLFTIYRFFTLDSYNTSWLSATITSLAQSSTISIDSTVQQLPQGGGNLSSNTLSGIKNSNRHLTQISNELRSFIRRINDTLILNESNNNNSITNMQQSGETLISSSNSNTPNSSPKRLIKYPSPTLPDYVSIYNESSFYALPERIMAIHSLIFIARQFYNLYPFLLEICRNEDFSSNIVTDAKKTEDGIKLLDFYHNELCASVQSLIQQCLFAVATKLLPYETIIANMVTTKWDLKEIPSIHSKYVDSFVTEIQTFSGRYIELLKSSDLTFMVPSTGNVVRLSNDLSEKDSFSSPLDKLYGLSKQINLILWECIIRTSNRCFVEGFASAKKCTNEGRALMQLDYQQFLSHLEKLISTYIAPPDNATRQAKALLTAEKEFVEEYVKAYYLTETIFLDWISQRHDYTNKQIISLVNCIAGDNRKLKSSLLAAIESYNMPPSSIVENSHHNNNAPMQN